MTVHKIRLYPDPLLKLPSKPVHTVTLYHRRLIRNLIETMAAQVGGIGIAAPQIGVLSRIAIVDVSKKDKHKKRLILINPEILAGSHEKVGREGCMSVPDYTGNVSRSLKILVQWYDENLRPRRLEADGIEAICIQHEIDHLDGYLFLNRVTSLTRDLFRRKTYL